MSEKQEIGNGAKMREALVQVELFLSRVERHGHPTLNPGDRCDACEGTEELRALVCAALAEPRRNCDVGTAEEQTKRFESFCQSNMQYYCDMFGTHEGAGGWDCKEDCPIGKMVDKNDYVGDHCQLLWAQMPYEEGGAK